VKQAPFYVLAGARMPAVLVEVGFVSHPEESRRLASAEYQEQVARAIAEGVAAWRGAGGHAAAP
jgi:N-acetylmuramoyl-L-alanine amidase